MMSLPHRCIADGIRDERECYRPFFCGVDVGNFQRVHAVGDLLVRVVKSVFAATRDDGVRGGNCCHERHAAGCFGAMMPKL